jgi:signal transduction histidine kinase
VQEALQELPAAIKEKQAVIATLTLPVIEGNRDQFRLLFKNLLENSIKFSKKDRAPQINIDSAILTAEEKRELDLDDNLPYYRIEIDDNGIGFKTENAQKIFHPFVRLHGKSQFPGNGIGLAICRKIMEIHHGIIYAEGRENEGSRFILILPESH